MSMLRALRKYIHMIVAETVNNPAAPQQFIHPRDGKTEEQEDSKDDMEEMSTVAGSLTPGGGFTAPLGYTSKDVEGPAAKGTHKKRKAPKWS